MRANLASKFLLGATLAMAVVLTVPATTASAVSTMRVDATAYQLNAAHTGVTTDRLSASPRRSGSRS